MYPTSDLYLSAVRGSRRETAVCEAWRGGVLLPGGDDLRLLTGYVTDNSKPGVRRQLDIGLHPTPGLFELLSPTGTELRVRSVLRFPRGDTETVPMGVFDVDSTSIGYGPGGSLTIQASDLWVRIQRARFLSPRASTPGLTIVQQIVELIRDVFGALAPVNVNVTSTAPVGSVVWDRDRDKAIIELAEAIGAWVYADRDGVWTIAPLPVGPPGAGVWGVDAGQDGILLEASRSRDRSKTYNVVVSASDKADGSVFFGPQVVWDDDPLSPTFAGTDPDSGADAGPFGVVPYFYASPLLSNAEQAREAGLAILTRVVGLNAQLSLSAVRNHALDALDPIDVRLPPDRYRAKIVGYLPGEPGEATPGGFGLQPFGTSPFGGSTGGTVGRPIVEYVNNGPVERHLVDKVVHPLTAEGTQRIDTRSTRTDEYT